MLTRKSRLIRYLRPAQLEQIKKIKLKIASGEYQLQAQPCLCGKSSKSEIYCENDRYGIPLTTKICLNCGMLRSDPYYSEETLNSFYNNEYRKLYSNMVTCTEDFFKLQYNSAEKIYSFLKEHIQSSRTCLDVGCGAGGVLAYFKNKGFEVHGIDIGEDYINFGKSKGLNLESIHIKELAERKIKYDFIIFNHVIEHLTNPDEFLSFMKPLMHENTLLFIGCPGIRNIREDYGSDTLMYLQNAHVYHYSLKTLRNLTSRNGFRLMRGDERVYSIFMLGQDLGNWKDDTIRCHLFMNELLHPIYRLILGIKVKILKL